MTWRIAFPLLLVGSLTTVSAPMQSDGTASWKVSSRVEGYSLISLDSLPRSPEHEPIDDSCEQYQAEKAGKAGQQVASRGWIVTSEAPLGHFTVVSFASGFDAGTSAICFARNANLGVFDGTRLIALAYARKGADSPLGVVEPLEDGGLLIRTDPPGAPIGELHEDENGLRLTPVAAQRTICGGRTTVPNIYDKPISSARDILISRGWKPQPPEEKPDAFDAASDLAKAGVVEAEACSGTGVGYCSFTYKGPGGTLLYVTTVGGSPNADEDIVVNNRADCASS